MRKSARASGWRSRSAPITSSGARCRPRPRARGRRYNETERRQLLGLPEENILYFLEKKAPLLKTWEREILRIVRHVAQYFYPQKQTKMMNEGCATFVHYYVMNRLHETGFLDDGAMMEFFQSHTGAVFQPDFDHPRLFRASTPMRWASA